MRHHAPAAVHVPAAQPLAGVPRQLGIPSQHAALASVMKVPIDRKTRINPSATDTEPGKRDLFIVHLLHVQTTTLTTTAGAYAAPATTNIYGTEPVTATDTVDQCSPLQKNLME